MNRKENKNSKYAGKFIVLDGPDGCGKSTQLTILSDKIKKNNVSIATYRDPGTTVIGEKIRQILLDTANEKMANNSEVMLYTASRAQLWHEKIKNDLALNKCVLLDRWVSSTCAYQGKAGGFGIENIIKLSNICLERVWPDLTIILDIDTETAKKRIKRALDRMEMKNARYHKKVRQGFLGLAEIVDNIVVIDASDTVENVHSNVLDAVERIL
jgi:dTMP kinase